MEINDLTIINNQTIENRIYTLRDIQVMLDEDLAVLYGVETKVFNQAVKRNIERFPEKFRFQLTQEEYDNLRFQSGTSSLGSSLRSQIVTLESQRGKHRKYLPYVFTEQGVSMLSAALRSQTAIEVSIKIIDTFVNMRKIISQNNYLFQRMDLLEEKQKNTDQKVDEILNAIESKNTTIKQGVFFEGQFFDAYIFISDILKNAKKSITLIDNYIGASLKDLSNKWFAFSKLEDDNLELLVKVRDVLGVRK